MHLAPDSSNDHIHTRPPGQPPQDPYLVAENCTLRRLPRSVIRPLFYSSWTRPLPMTEPRRRTCMVHVAYAAMRPSNPSTSSAQACSLPIGPKPLNRLRRSLASVGPTAEIPRYSFSPDFMAQVTRPTSSLSEICRIDIECQPFFSPFEPRTKKRHRRRADRPSRIEHRDTLRRRGRSNFASFRFRSTLTSRKRSRGRLERAPEVPPTKRELPRAAAAGSPDRSA